MTNVNETLRDHVTLTVDCMDRIYLNGYIPNLKMPGQLVTFPRKHWGNPIPSRALLGKIGDQFAQAIQNYAQKYGIPPPHFEPGRCKEEIAALYRQHFTQTVGLVFIGNVKEKAQSFKARKKDQKGMAGFEWSHQSVQVNHYYFYLQDADFGPAFIKVCSYVPYPIKVYLNGHEWTRQQLHQAGIEFEALDNGFLSCQEPEKLQAFCDQLGAEQIQAFFDKWVEQLPIPLTAEDRQAGYAHRISVWQAEISRTQVFDDPVRGREFFEGVIQENLDLGKPDQVQLVFDRKTIVSTPDRFRTRVIEYGVNPSLHFEYKKAVLKQFSKENRALRTEKIINDPKDFYMRKDLSSLPFLKGIGREINRRRMNVQRTSHNCHLSQESVERVVLPTVTPDGQRAPGLRFGQTRTKALLAALTLFVHNTYNFRHPNLLPQVADLLGSDYSAHQLTYDLRRLRFKGILWRMSNSHCYLITPYGCKVALFFIRLHALVFRWAVLFGTRFF